MPVDAPGVRAGAHETSTPSPCCSAPRSGTRIARPRRPLASGLASPGNWSSIWRHAPAPDHGLLPSTSIGWSSAAGATRTLAFSMPFFLHFRPTSSSRHWNPASPKEGRINSRSRSARMIICWSGFARSSWSKGKVWRHPPDCPARSRPEAVRKYARTGFPFHRRWPPIFQDRGRSVPPPRRWTGGSRRSR